MQTDILTRTSFFTSVALGLVIAVAGCANSALDTGAGFDSLSKNDLGYQILSIDDLDTLEHSGVAIKWGSGAVMFEDSAMDLVQADVRTSGGEISCYIGDSGSTYIEDPGYLIQDGPNCWKYAWLNANYELDSTFDSSEKLSDFDACLTAAGINPQEGLMPDQRDEVAECKKKITEIPGTGYTGKKVEIKRQSWSDFYNGLPSAGSGDGAPPPPSYSAPEESSSPDDSEAADDSMGVMWIEGTVIVFVAEIVDEEGNPTGEYIVRIVKTKHALSIKKMEKNEDGDVEFEAVDPNGGKVTGTIDKDGKINAGAASTYTGWTVTSVSIETPK
jgi:hypothetical protein